MKHRIGEVGTLMPCLLHWALEDIPGQRRSSPWTREGRAKPFDSQISSHIALHIEDIPKCKPALAGGPGNPTISGREHPTVCSQEGQGVAHLQLRLSFKETLAACKLQVLPLAPSPFHFLLEYSHFWPHLTWVCYLAAKRMTAVNVSQYFVSFFS